MKRNLLNIILVVGGVAFMCMSIYFFLSEEIGFGLIFFLFYILEIVAIGKNNQQKRKEAEQEKLAKEAAEKERLLKERAGQERKAKQQAEQERKEKLKEELAEKAKEKAEKEAAEKERLLKEKEERERKAKEAAAGNRQKQRFCTNCGKPLTDNSEAVFCMYCGAKTEAKTDEKTDIKTDGKTNQVNNSKKKYEDQIVLHEGKCPVCGKDTEETDSVCTNCGFPVISIAGNITKREKDKIIEAVKEYRKNMT